MAKKKNEFLDKYKTHDGERGDTEKWKEAARKAFLLKEEVMYSLLRVDSSQDEFMLANPEATPEEIEEKLTKIGKRKLQVD